MLGKKACTQKLRIQGEVFPWVFYRSGASQFSEYWSLLLAWWHNAET
jgi:hypothetical protein